MATAGNNKPESLTTTTTRRVRVFLASPGDVTEERELARTVIDKLRNEFRYKDRIKFEIVAWDQPGAAVAQEATMTPQAAIAKGLPKPSECDMVVVLLWSRMGTPLPAEYTKPDGNRYLSGTEWEFCNAMEAATHGDPANDYPWGREWDNRLANTSESRLSCTTAAGMYPLGASRGSPEGALDMAGNVLEWCLNKYHKPDDTTIGGDEARVLRGGSWFDDQNFARTAYRNCYNPYYRYYFIGFRLCCESPIS